MAVLRHAWLTLRLSWLGLMQSPSPSTRSRRKVRTYWLFVSVRGCPPSACVTSHSSRGLLLHVASRIALRKLVAFASNESCSSSWVRCLILTSTSVSASEVLRLAAPTRRAASVEAFVSARPLLLFWSTGSVTVATVVEANGAKGGGCEGGGSRGGGGGDSGGDAGGRGGAGGGPCGGGDGSPGSASGHGGGVLGGKPGKG
eukprot:scaffold98695_cov57-Phaeocystis_antarctica.AAC.3